MDILINRYHKLLDTTSTDKVRFLYNQIDWDYPLIGIRGQRGVGKTTLMLQRIKLSFPDVSKAFYANLDSVWFGQNNLIDLAEILTERGVTHLFIDEVHKLPGWEKQVKYLYDSYPELKVVFTGSSLLIIDNAVGDLSRRAVMYDLPGLSFREFLMFEDKPLYPRLELKEILYDHERLCHELTQDISILKEFKKYLETGFYPYYKKMRADNYYIAVAQSIIAVIENDIPAVAKTISYETLMKAKGLVNIIANNCPYLPNYEQLAGILRTTRSHLVKLFDLLDRGGIIRELFAEERGPKSLAKAQKVLFNNSVLMYALGQPNIGTVRESAFASMLAVGHKLNYSKRGDLIVDNRYIFEVGGRIKNDQQIRNIPDSFVVKDDIDFGYKNMIPMWLFGFLY